MKVSLCWAQKVPAVEDPGRIGAVEALGLDETLLACAAVPPNGSGYLLSAAIAV